MKKILKGKQIADKEGVKNKMTAVIKSIISNISNSVKCVWTDALLQLEITLMAIR